MTGKKKLIGNHADLYDSDLYLKAERHERATKEWGKQNGALGAIGKQVFGVCLLSADEDGAVNITPTRIAEETGLARASVYTALNRLISAGALIRDGDAYRVNLSWSPG